MLETRELTLVDSFYDPTTGQFLQRDPIAPITRSPYGYVGGNPLNLVDPSGLCGEPEGFIGPTLPCPSIFDLPRAPAESPVPTYWPSACLAQDLGPNAPCPPPRPAGCDDEGQTTATPRGGGNPFREALLSVESSIGDYVEEVKKDPVQAASDAVYCAVGMYIGGSLGQLIGGFVAAPFGAPEVGIVVGGPVGAGLGCAAGVNESRHGNPALP